MGEGVHVCGYIKCGRSYDTPVRLTDLSHKPDTETYYACPYCFSKVNESEEDLANHEMMHLRGGGYEVTEAASKKSPRPATQKESENVANCPHHLGYLKTRSKDQSLPDACLTCPKILQCM